LTVTTTADTLPSDPYSGVGPLSLRQAVQLADANPGSTTIILPAGTYNLLYDSPALPGGDSAALELTSNVSIAGAGSSQSIINGSAVGDRVFVVTGGGTSNIAGVTIEGGRAQGGGGILNDGATLTVTNSVITNNQANPVVAGLPALGGGIQNTAGSTLTLSNTAVTVNQAFGAVGGQALGGGVFNAGSASIDHSVISNNLAQAGDGADGQGGGIYNVGVLSLTNSSVTGNTARGGDANDFTGVTFTSTFATNGAATAVASAFSTNKINQAIANGNVYGRGTSTASAAAGNGADGQGGGVYNAGKATLTSDSINNNKAVGGNGLGFAFAPPVPGPLPAGTPVVGHTATSTATLSGNGSVTVTTDAASGGNGQGGGIYNAQFSTLTVASSVVFGNQAIGGNGGFGNPAVANATASLTGSGTVISNASVDAGGDGDGGGLFNGGIATLTSVQFTNNRTVGGLGGSIMGGKTGVSPPAQAAVTMRGTGSVTATASAGGGGNAYGGGWFNASTGVLSLKTITLSGNQANAGNTGAGSFYWSVTAASGQGVKTTILNGLRGVAQGLDSQNQNGGIVKTS
jgi:hypothetical protein